MQYVFQAVVLQIQLPIKHQHCLLYTSTAASIAYGYDLLNKQDYGQAILYFEDAIDLNANEASAYFGFAQANEKMGCTDIALTNYETVSYTHLDVYKRQVRRRAQARLARPSEGFRNE